MRKSVLSFLIIMVLAIGLADAQTRNSTKKKKAPKKPAPPTEVSIPARSSDCFFAAPLMVDVAFGPTEPLRGYGFVNEIKPDNRVKNVFNSEHNTIWYILSIPYSGKLCIDITPRASSDDYDFLVYKYTDKYFCNRIIGNKVTPIRSVMSTPNTAKGGKTGLNLTGNLINIPKNSSVDYGKYIDVKEGEKYVIVVDNRTNGGLGHTIYATVNTDFAPLTVLPIDSLNRERTTANIYVKEAGSENLILEKHDVGAQRLKILPNKTYSISLKKDGYFNYYREVSHPQAKKDSLLTARMIEIKPGSNLPINGEIFFDVDEMNNITILPDSYKILEDVVKLLQEYPSINIEIIGRIATEGLNLRKDAEISKQRAEAIKNYLISRGIPESNIRTRGSYLKELEQQLASQKKLRSGGLIYPKQEIRIIKSK